MKNQAKFLTLILLTFITLFLPVNVYAKYKTSSETKHNTFPTEIVWKYTIHFDANSGQGEMTDRIIRKPYRTYKLPATGFTKYGNTFKGWNNEPNGTGNINIECNKDEEPIISSPLSKIDDDTITLYAQWEPITYHIIYDANGGIGEDIIQSVKWTASGTDNDAIARIYSFSTECGFSKVNHQFLGWSTNRTGPVLGAMNTDENGYYQSGTQHNYIDSNGNVQNIYGLTPDQLKEEPLTLYAIYRNNYSGSNNEGYYKISGTSQKGGDSLYKHWHLTNKETTDKDPYINNVIPGGHGKKYTGIFYIGDTVNSVETIYDSEKWDQNEFSSHEYTDK